MLGKMAEVYAEHGLHIYSVYVVVAINYARTYVNALLYTCFGYAMLARGLYL